MPSSPDGIVSASKVFPLNEACEGPFYPTGVRWITARTTVLRTPVAAQSAQYQK